MIGVCRFLVLMIEKVHNFQHMVLSSDFVAFICSDNVMFTSILLILIFVDYLLWKSRFICCFLEMFFLGSESVSSSGIRW